MSSATSPHATDRKLYGQITQLCMGHMPAACIYAVAKLKIPDLLAAGPKPASELARACGVNGGALYRVLRAIASVGVFREAAPQVFENTALSEMLRSDIPGSARDTVLFLSDSLHLRVFAELMHSIETGETVFRKVTGMEPFDFFRHNDEENKAFNAAMASISANSVPPAVEAYDFGESGTLADIGGGHGTLMALILQKHLGLRGIVFDLPHVVAGAKARIEALGLASRCELVGGDFFEGVPIADNYVVKSIIHDWDESRAIAILQNCAKSMRGANGRIILLEQVIAAGNQPDSAKWIDMEMLTMAGGRERSEVEYSELLAKAGLRLVRVVKSASPYSAIEAVKAR